MDYESLKEGTKRKHKRKPSPMVASVVETNDKSLGKTTATKLFSYLLCHGEDCRMELSFAVKRLHKFSGRSLDQKEALDFIKTYRERFEVKTVEGRQFIEAKTTVKLCDAFQEGKCRAMPVCKQLHICRFFLQGSCKFGDSCKKPHSFDSPETMSLLQDNKLNNLPTEALRNLFRKVLNEKKIKHASKTSGPEPCKFYNKGECKNGDKCEFLHVCEHYVNGDCKFGEKNCKRFHHFDTTHSRKVLAAHSLGGLRNESQILLILRHGTKVTSQSSDSDDDSGEEDNFIGFLRSFISGPKMKPKASSPRQVQEMMSETTEVDEKVEICGFNLRGKCNYGDKCHARHTSLPYEWQYCLDPGLWKSFSASETRKIETEFCDCDEDSVRVKSNEGSICTIDFQAMTGKLRHRHGSISVKIRRLSTVSSVLAATGHVFRTKWKWYWKDEHDTWHCYDDGKADTSSEKLEQAYQSESGERNHRFLAGSNKYTLYFDDPNQMYQKNDQFRTKRDVRRRPAKFLDEEGMKRILDEFKRNRQRTTSSSSDTVSSVPLHWAPLDPSQEFTVVDLKSDEVLDQEEFTMVKKQFLVTMPDYTVKSIKRVQNTGLWEDYERQKSKITKKNSGQLPEERWLFHGTKKDIVNPICQQGFDWRLSGKHGARYGKGSYFATEASYSHNYSARGSSGNSKMFLAKVIVGSFVVGSYETQRPPAKDSCDSLSALHDSCVNNVSNPTIFVIFERSQAYPYYIIDYGE